MKHFLSVTILFFIALSVSAQEVGPGSIHPDVVRIDMDEWFPFSEGLAAIRKGDKWAFIDTTGKVVIPWGKVEPWRTSDYHEVRFQHGRLLVIVKQEGEFRDTNNLFGYCDDQGEMVIAPKYKMASDFYFDYRGRPLAYVEKEVVSSGFESGTRESLFIDREGKVIFTLGNTMSYFGNRGYSITTLPSSFAKTFIQEGRVSVFSLGGNRALYGFIGMDGEIVIPTQFEQASNFSEGLAAVAKKDEFGEIKWGYINRNGEITIEYKFSKKPSEFKHGLARVFPKDSRSSGFEWAYIDTIGRVVFQAKNELVRSMKTQDFEFEGILLKKRAGEYNMYHSNYWLDREGNEMEVPVQKVLDVLGVETGYFEFDEQAFADSHYWLVRYIGGPDADKALTGNSGFVNREFELVIPFFFRSIRLKSPLFFDNRAMLRLASDATRTGYINRQGVFVILKAKEGDW